MAAKRFLKLVGGKITSQQGKDLSVGAADEGAIVALDATGKIDPSMMPVGVAADVSIAEASEALTAGAYVNIYDDTGTAKVRLADNSNGRPAHGFVVAPFAITENASIYYEGSNDNAAVGVAGQRVYLGVTGGVITTPLDPDTDTGKIHQLLGTYVTTGSINTDIDDCIQL